MKILIALILITMLTSCGAADRAWSWATGDAGETCMAGVLYYQFTSGAAVAYNTDGTVKTCK